MQADLAQLIAQLSNQNEKGPGDYLREVLADLEERQQGIRHGLTTGIPILDNRTGGFQPGNFVILAARPSTGKSAFLVHWLLHHLLDLQQGAGLFTLEMTGKEVLSRKLAYQTGYSNFQLQRDDKLDLNYIHQKLGGLPTMPLHIWERSIQLPELLNTAREWHRKDGISLVAVDFIQLVRDSRYNKALDRVTEVSTNLKALAQDTGMVVVGLSQLSRECDKRSGWDRRPVLSDLRDSGSLEQDANNVLMLFSPHRNNLRYDDGSSNEHTLEIHALKLRNGKPTQPGPDPGDNGPLVVNYDAAVNRILSRSDRPGQDTPVGF